MRDAIGGVVSINLIIFFLVLINGYLAYSVNYTKAFRVKNRIVSIIEEYEGHTAAAQVKINDYIQRNGYYVPIRMMESATVKGYTCFQAHGYCISSTPAGNYDSINQYNQDSDAYRGWNYQVITYVNINIPVINKILPGLGQYLQVVGETKPVYSEDGIDYYRRESD